MSQKSLGRALYIGIDSGNNELIFYPFKELHDKVEWETYVNSNLSKWMIAVSTKGHW